MFLMFILMFDMELPKSSTDKYSQPIVASNDTNDCISKISGY